MGLDMDDGFDIEVQRSGLSWSHILIPSALKALTCQSGHLVLFKGHQGIFAIGHYLMAWRLIEGERVVLIDSANVFDLPFITKMARAFKRDERKLLEQISISRAFTVHQLETVIRNRLAQRLKICGGRLCFISGLLDTFWDEEVPLWEAVPILRRIIAQLRSLSDLGYRVIILAPDPPVSAVKREGLSSILIQAADRVFTLR